MLQTKNRNLKRMGAVALLGFLASVSANLTSPVSAEAASLPTVTATFMDPVGTTSLRPGTLASSVGNFYVPIKIDVQDADLLSVSVKAANADLLGKRNLTNKINSIPDGAEYTIDQMENQWGYRWNLGDTIDDVAIVGSSPKNYRQMPTALTLLDTVSVSGSRNTTVTKYLTLGFGVGVNGETPADTYTNEVTVSVVATPLGMTIFGIAYMQDMTADICYNTTTPTTNAISTSANINVGPNGEPYTDLIDTTGAHQGDSNYVPQKELIDKRDGKKYTVRKLADGNCWMVSNLEFDFVPTASKDIATGITQQSAFSTTGTDTLTGEQLILTSADTDLHSITTWTPENAAKLYGSVGSKVYTTQRNAALGQNVEGSPSVNKGTGWDGGGSDGMHSFSSAVGYPDGIYSTKTSVTPAFGVANPGEPWQKFGNLYNWTAATLGSGTKVATNGSNAEDSICPRGWKLPDYTNKGSFQNLFTTYSISTNNAASVNKMANFPLNFLRTGAYGYERGNLNGRTNNGSWWSATINDAPFADCLQTSVSMFLPRNRYYRGYGFAIRCVAR